METGCMPSGKVPFLLVLYTLLHHKHLITEDKFNVCVRACGRVCTCNNLLLRPLNVKGFVSWRDVKKQLFYSADWGHKDV